jgi:hypothetical protein
MVRGEAKHRKDEERRLFGAFLCIRKVGLFVIKRTIVRIMPKMIDKFFDSVSFKT